jgi:hypothetical protein
MLINIELLDLHFLALLYLILLYMKKWAFNIKLESGTTTQKWFKRPEELSKGKVQKIENNSLKVF